MKVQEFGESKKVEKQTLLSPIYGDRDVIDILSLTGELRNRILVIDKDA